MDGQQLSKQRGFVLEEPLSELVALQEHGRERARIVIYHIKCFVTAMIECGDDSEEQGLIRGEDIVNGRIAFRGTAQYSILDCYLHVLIGLSEYTITFLGKRYREAWRGKGEEEGFLALHIPLLHCTKNETPGRAEYMLISWPNR